MLNDVHIPPAEPNAQNMASKHRSARSPTERDSHRTANRVRDRLPTAARADIGEAIYGEPEDRGDSFNTGFSALVVGVVFAVAIGLAWIAFR